MWGASKPWSYTLTTVGSETAKQPTLLGGLPSHSDPPIRKSVPRIASARDSTKIGWTCVCVCVCVCVGGGGGMRAWMSYVDKNILGPLVHMRVCSTSS